MSPRGVVITFTAAVLAVVVGWLGGALARDVIGSEPEVAIGVVDAEAGVPVTSASPTPAATTAAPVTPSETATVAPSPTVATPAASLGPCPGTPPRDGCECRQRGRNARWVCPLFDDDDDDE